MIRRAVVADEGWRLVVADADQMEPRVLAAISRDRGLMEVAGHEGDLYKALSDRAFHGDRDHAKIALLGAVYGQTSGDGLKNLAALRRRFPQAVAYVDDAAKAGEEGRLVRTWLGRTSPPAVGADEDGEAGIPRRARSRRPAKPPARTDSPRATRRRTLGRGAASPATSWSRAAPRTGRCCSGGAAADTGRRGYAGGAGVLPARRGDRALPGRGGVRSRGSDPGGRELAGRVAFGETPVRFPFTTAVVERYADAK